MIYINKIENRITFKIKTRYYLQLVTEVVLVHCNIVNNNYQQNSRVFQIMLIYHTNIR